MNYIKEEGRKGGSKGGRRKGGRKEGERRQEGRREGGRKRLYRGEKEMILLRKGGEDFPEEATDLNIKGQTELSLRRLRKSFREGERHMQEYSSAGLAAGELIRKLQEMRSRPDLDPAVS